MLPTKKMWDAEGKIDNPTHRMFKCSECGFEAPWLDKPVLNGCYGELHMTKDRMASALSMMSDPYFMAKMNSLRVQIKMFQE
jgi:hypothetical protein